MSRCGPAYVARNLEMGRFLLWGETKGVLLAYCLVEGDVNLVAAGISPRLPVPRVTGFPPNPDLVDYARVLQRVGPGSRLAGSPRS